MLRLILEARRGLRNDFMQEAKVCLVEGCGRSYSALGLCTRHYNAKKRAENPERVKAWKKAGWARNREKYNLKRRLTPKDLEAGWAKRIFAMYGITAEEYYVKLQKQQGGCAICKSLNPKHRRSGKFCIDHDHATGKVRDLLCQHCNAALGHLKENLSLFVACMDYLRRHGKNS